MKKIFNSFRARAGNVSSQLKSDANVSPDPPSNIPTTTSSQELAQRTFTYFYSPQNHQFQARTKSEGTLGEQDHYGYVVWPVIISVHAFAETLPHPQLKDAIMCLQEYWNSDFHGFCAWKMFPGNEDIYYDDNAHACQALISAYQATGDLGYLKQTKEILTELIMPAALKDGGVPWHINNKKCRNACSTGPAAVAALRLCAIEHDQNLLAFAERALNWIVEMLQDPTDGLIWDSLVYGADGEPNINKMKWTYNVGFAIHGFTLLFEATNNPKNLDIARSLAQAALDPSNPLFDQSVKLDMDRMYSDSSFFLHHLVDGFRALAKHAEATQLQNMTHYIAAWGKDFMFDAKDGLYFRGSVPYTIDDERTKKFNDKFQLCKDLEKNSQERDEKGNLCKTLIGCSSWARVFFAEEEIQLLQLK